MTEGSKPHRFRFSLKTLIALISIGAFTLSSWLVYSAYRIQRILELRQQGSIVIIRDHTPAALKAIGVERMSPFYDVATVELYVTPSGDTASLGDSRESMSRADAEAVILEQATIARGYGAKEIQLILIDSFDPQWLNLADANGMASIGEDKGRYLKRLKANRETGANINP